MIDSPIHHLGGPLFLVLSLILLEWRLLWRAERGVVQSPHMMWSPHMM